jgi:hypothetical protein
MADWTSMLQGPPQTQVLDVPGQMQAGRTTALAQQSAAIKNQADAYELQKAQGLQAAFANGIETVAGPPDKNGNPTVAHKFNQDKFLAGLQENPAALEAYKSYVEKAYPQIQTETANQVVPKLLGTNGQVSGPQTTQAMADNPNAAGTVLSTAMNLQAAQQKSVPQAIGTNLEVGATGAQGDNGSGVGSIEANATMQPKVPGFGADGEYSTPQGIAKLAPSDRKALVRKLNATPFPPASDSMADIAASNAKWQSAHIGQSLGSVDPTNPLSVSAWAAGAPVTAANATGEAIQGGYQAKGSQLSQASAQLGLTDEERKKDLADTWRERGFAANTGNVDKIQGLAGPYEWLFNTSDDIKTLKAQAAKGKTDPDLFNSTISALSNAPMVAESISNLAGQQRFLENIRTDPSYGALIKAADGNPIHFMQALTSAKLGAQSQEKVLQVLGNIVDTQLKTGQAFSSLNQYRAGAAPGWVGDLKKPPPGKKARRMATAEDF